jgi:hypothetical protein
VASAVTASAQSACANFWSLLEHLYDKGGISALAFLLAAYAFHRLAWKVWTTAMKCKDDEIERLIDQRDFYQSKVFPGQLTSDGQQNAAKRGDS